MADLITPFKQPKGLEVYTQVVFDDEPCFLLVESNRLDEASTTMCRFQILRIVRKDALVTACVCLGPSSGFQADGFNVPGGWIDDDGKGEAVHTVAELQEIAHFLRTEPPRRELEPWDLDAAYKNHVEEKIKIQNHQSTFASHTAIVRN